MHLVLASRAATSAALGRDAFDRIGPDLDRYLEASGARGVPAVLAVLDDAASMEAIGLAASGLPARDAARLAINAVSATTAVESVLLVGGDRIFPFFEFANPIVDRRLDPDATVPSDNPYGVIGDPGLESAAWLAPTLAVGRVLDGGDAETFRRAIAQLSADAGARRAGACAVYNADWLAPSMDVAAELGAPVDAHMSPPYQVSTVNRQDLDRRIVYMNLHGFTGQPAWQSYDASLDRFFDVVRPDVFTPETCAGALIVSEACYGAEVTNRTAATSCAVSAQAAGAAVIGATGLLWGSVLRPWAYVDDGDALAKCVLSSLAAVGSIGAALVQGRRAFLAQRAGNAYEQKTALQFVLLGDPTVSV